MRTVLRWIGILLALLVVSVVVLLLTVDWNWLKHYAVGKASDAIRQPLTITGDIDDVKIVGDGFIDLGKELVDIKLKPKAKDVSAFSADAPIHVQGPLNHPSVSTNLGEALLSLATPVEAAEAEPADCQVLVEQTQQETSSSKP